MTNRIAQLRKGAAHLPGGAGRRRGRDPADHHLPENGRYNASLLLAHKIAKYFGMTIEEVFLFEEEEE